ncbi:hypothetical protein CERSUDRAFT_111996 [Gelatoporia subvermispora B]|uniref:Uncharacterized protein n=1 Tax=Ceriporiopsis subvermispora (strain B) TaxID=914234 RepID=M2RLG0_CERS8|nr:hypothetical protein CERSUDRAFT_111996 [Gelatoporia subvermispora B]
MGLTSCDATVGIWAIAHCRVSVQHDRCSTCTVHDEAGRRRDQPRHPILDSTPAAYRLRLTSELHVRTSVIYFRHGRVYAHVGAELIMYDRRQHPLRPSSTTRDRRSSSLHQITFDGTAWMWYQSAQRLHHYSIRHITYRRKMTEDWGDLHVRKGRVCSVPGIHGDERPSGYNAPSKR